MKRNGRSSWGKSWLQKLRSPRPSMYRMSPPACAGFRITPAPPPTGKHTFSRRGNIFVTKQTSNFTPTTAVRGHYTTTMVIDAWKQPRTREISKNIILFFHLRRASRKGPQLWHCTSSRRKTHFLARSRRFNGRTSFRLRRPELFGWLTE